RGPVPGGAAALSKPTRRLAAPLDGVVLGSRKPELAEPSSLAEHLRQLAHAQPQRGLTPPQRAQSRVEPANLFQRRELVETSHHRAHQNLHRRMLRASGFFREISTTWT